MNKVLPLVALMSCIPATGMSETVVERFNLPKPTVSLTVYETLSDFNSSKLEPGYNVVTVGHRGKVLAHTFVIVAEDMHTICDVDIEDVRHNLYKSITEKGEISAIHGFRAHLVLLNKCNYHLPNDKAFKKVLNMMVFYGG